MTLRLGALQDALLDAGASPDKATRASEELANYEKQFADLSSDIKLMKWILATNTAILLGVLLRLLAL